MDADIIIVGAGVAGALAAWRLSSHGHKVMLVDAGSTVGRSGAIGQWPSWLYSARDKRSKRINDVSALRTFFGASGKHW